MRTRVTIAGFLCSLLILGSAPNAQAAHPSKPGEILVKFKNGTSQATIDSIYTDLGATRVKRFTRIGAEHDRISRRAVKDAIARYKNHPAIAFIEPNYIVTAVRTPTDTLFPQMWGLRNTGQNGGLPGADIDAVSAWDTSTGSQDIVVAIIDTGIDYNHPDLAANIYTNTGEIPGNGIDDDGNGYTDDIRGWDFVNGDNDPFDDAGHGTHVAGTVGAVGNNAIGVVGVCWSVRLMPLKFLSAFGSGSTADAIACIEYATMMHVNVMSNSWGGDTYSEAMRLAIANASDAGILFVAAAGNSHTDNDVFPFYPASYDVPNVISVAATNRFDELAGFSCFGATSVDLAAPGQEILSTTRFNTYGTLSGTSMATPHVSGALALVMSQFPGIPPLSAKALLINSVDRLPSLDGLMVSNGRLNIARALQGPDLILPAPVGDLIASGSGSNSVTLEWTATGDDGTTGTAAEYDLRYATFPINDANFSGAIPFTGAPAPLPAGSRERVEVRGLVFNTSYYFALRVRDEYGNTSPISNVVSGTTLGPPDIDVTPAALSAALLTGGTATQTLTLRNLSAGTLDFSVDVQYAAPPPPPPPPDSGYGAARPTLWSAYVQAAAADSTPHPYEGARITTMTLPPVITDPPGDSPAPDVIALRGLSSNGNLEVEMEFAAPIDAFNFGGFLSLDTDRNPLTGVGPSFGNGLQDIGAEYEFTLFSLGSGIVLLYNAVTGTQVGQFPVQFGVRSFRFSVPLALLGNDDGSMDVTGVIGNAIGPTDWFPNSGHGTIFGLQWLSATPRTGTVPPGGSVDVAVTFDAHGLFGGGYDASVRVASNDPDEAIVAVPTHLDVTGAPDITLSTAALSFGPVFLGASRMDSLSVTNEGTDRLDVTEVTSSRADFETGVLPFSLNPGESRTVVVTFRPGSAGEISGTLRVRSNDSDESELLVALSGTGVQPPDVSVSPDALSAALLTGEATTQTLTVSNSGATDLIADFSVRRANPPAGLGVGPASLLPRDLDSQASTDNGSVFPQDGDDSLAAVLVIQDTPAWSLDMADFLQSEFGINATVIHSDEIEGTDFSRYDVITTVGDESFAYYNAISSNAAKFEAYVSAGGVVQYQLATQGANVQLAGGALMNYGFLEYTNRVLLSRHPIVVGLPLTLEGNYANHCYVSQLPARTKIITETFNSHVPTTVEYQIGAGTVIATGMTWEYLWTRGYIAGAMLFKATAYSLASSRPRWVRVSPRSATVPPGGNLNVTVTFDAFGLLGGAYDGLIRVASNDPDESVVLVPAHLVVTGAPDIALSNSALNFGPVFIGVSLPETLIVSNLGTDVLSVTSLTMSRADFTVNAGAFTLAPGDSRPLVVAFSPLGTGLIDGTLSIASNDHDEGVAVVTLHGQGLIAPDIGVTPASLTAGLRTGETTTRQVTIRNTGGSDLVFAVSRSGTIFSPAAACSLGSGGPGSSSATLIPTSSALAVVGATGAALSRAGVALSMAGAVTATDPAQTSSPGVQGQPPAPQVSISNGNNILVIATTSVENSIFRALRELNLGFDFRFTTDFTGIDFTTYNTIIVGMDGGIVSEESCQALANAADDGRLVFIVGGTNWSTYYTGVQRYLLSHTGETGWTISGSPHLIVRNASDPLARGLPPTYTFSNLGASYYMLRINDPAAPVAVGNGDNHPVLVHKAIGAGTLVYFTNSASDGYWGAQGDFSILKQIVDNALGFAQAPWLSVQPNSGTVPAGGEITLQVGFDASGLDGGEYSSEIRISSNDPDEATVVVPAHLSVTGVPVIAVHPTSLTYAPLFVGQTSYASLSIENQGTQNLTVALSTDNPAFSPAVADLVIPPRHSQGISVAFSPTSPGSFSATLRLDHNAAGSPTQIPLTGSAMLPPVIAVSPSSIHADLNAGDSGHRALNIANTAVAGASDLHFTVDTRVGANAVAVCTDAPPGKGALDPPAGNPVTARAGGPDLFGYRWVDSDQPGGPTFTWVDIESLGTPISIFGDDQNSGPIPIGFSFPYYGVPYSNFNVCTNGFLSFTSRDATFGNQPLPSAYAPENLLAPFWDDLYFTPGASAQYYNDGTRLIVQFTSVQHYPGQGGPYTFEIILYPTGAILYQYLSMGDPLTSATVGFQNGTRDDGLTIAYDQPYIHNNLAIRIAAAPSWLTVSPDSGAVAPGGVQPIDVAFDGSGLFPGDYNASINVASNDPVRPQVAVPASLHIIGVPNLRVSPTALAYDTLFIGQSAERMLRFTNVGTDRLDVFDIAAGFSDFTATPRAFSLAPLQSREIPIRFNATVAGDRNTELVISTNEPRPATRVPITAVALVPPQFSLEPRQVVAAALPGGRKEKSVHICNQGGSDLRWASTVPLPAPSPITAPGYLPLGKGEADPRPGILGNGGPDAAAHFWVDSDDPGGPVFQWEEIANIGTRIPFSPSADDENRGPFPIGFEFPFYENRFTEFRVCTNGWISFTSASLAAANQPLPTADPYVPENLLAALWDDLVLDAGLGSSVYYYSDGNRLIVEYINLKPFAIYSPTAYTFQVILNRNGEIRYQYRSLGSTTQSATIGIQNEARNDGLTVAYNAPYLHSQLAVRIFQPPAWLTFGPTSGVVRAGGCADVAVAFDAAALEAGDHAATASFSSNDPVTPAIAGDFLFHVGSVNAAASEVTPNSLNLGSNGNWVTGRVELPPPYSLENVVHSTVRLMGVVPAAAEAPTIGDFNNNGIPDLQYKFDRAAAVAAVPEGEAVEVTLTGEIQDVTYFLGRSTIRVIRPHVTAPNGGETVRAGSAMTISWTNPSGYQVDHADIGYSLDGGASWQLVAAGVQATSYTWIAPQASTSRALVSVQVYDHQGVLGYDVSNSMFTIQPTISSVETEAALPKKFALHQNSPNPFNPETTLPFDMPSAAPVALRVFSVDGRLVREWRLGLMPAGRHRLRWDGRDGSGRTVGSGVYFYRLNAGTYEDSRTMILLK